MWLLFSEFCFDLLLKNQKRKGAIKRRALKKCLRSASSVQLQAIEHTRQELLLENLKKEAADQDSFTELTFRKASLRGQHLTNRKQGSFVRSQTSLSQGREAETALCPGAYHHLRGIDDTAK